MPSSTRDSTRSSTKPKARPCKPELLQVGSARAAFSMQLYSWLLDMQVVQSSWTLVSCAAARVLRQIKLTTRTIANSKPAVPAIKPPSPAS